jgi:hypothetical protein
MNTAPAGSRHREGECSMTSETTKALLDTKQRVTDWKTTIKMLNERRTSLEGYPYLNEAEREPVSAIDAIDLVLRHCKTELSVAEVQVECLEEAVAQGHDVAWADDEFWYKHGACPPRLVEQDATVA